MNLINTFSQDSCQHKGSVQVSIVMPSFNQAEFIEKSISSVLEQQVEDLELIVMDGGSSDGTLQVLEQMSIYSNGRLSWYSGADHGAAHALNRAFALARAPVIGWLNSDDLYTPDAIEQALSFFNTHADMLMVYGRGQHIDATGEILDDYPTLPPSTDITLFRDGCFICQPTVFLRRELLNKVGLLDEELQTAFDFDLWLRVFREHQQDIGFIDEVLAYSRLHDACKTRVLGRTVVVESMQILSNHLGVAPCHWVLSYLDKLFEHYPHGQGPADIKQHCRELVSEVRGYLDDTEADSLESNLLADARLNITLPDACINIYQDAWLPPLSFLRIRAIDQKWHKIVLHCQNKSPLSKKINLSILTSWGETLLHKIKRRGEFKIDIYLPSEYELPCYWSFMIKTDDFFVPSEVEDSNDSRELAFKIEKIQLFPAQDD